MDNYVKLVTALSPQKLLRGPEKDLLKCAKKDEHFGKGFEKKPVSYKNKNRNLNFVLLYHEHFKLVIFPGSKMLENWIPVDGGNFNLDQIEYQSGKVHEGFWNHVNSYWATLVSLLKECPNIPVVFAGHSRGGACALISALRFNDEQSQVPIEAIITIGQPMCVDLDLANEIDRLWPNKYIRVVRSTDIIPLGPPNLVQVADTGLKWLYEKSGNITTTRLQKPINVARAGAKWIYDKCEKRPNNSSKKIINYAHAGIMWFYDEDGKLTITPNKEQIMEAIRKDNSALQTHESKLDFAKALLAQAIELKRGHDIKHYWNVMA